jgi:hypothetical protein
MKTIIDITLVTLPLSILLAISLLPSKYLYPSFNDHGKIIQTQTQISYHCSGWGFGSTVSKDCKKICTDYIVYEDQTIIKVNERQCDNVMIEKFFPKEKSHE